MDPEDDCWVGLPGPLPQNCWDGNCEILRERKHEKEKFPGHGENLTQDNAWGIVAQRLESARLHCRSRVKLAGGPDYYTFRKDGKKYTVMTVPLDVPDPKKRDSTRRLYFGVELDSAATLTAANDANVKELLGGGRVTVTYTINGDKRTAIVWLKN